MYSSHTDTDIPVKVEGGSPILSEIPVFQPDMDLRLVKNFGDYYVFDHLQRDGSNMIERLEPQNGQAKPSLSDVRYQSMYKGVDINKDDSTNLTSVTIQGRKCLGHFVDFKFRDAMATSHNMPLHKDANDFPFII